MPEETGTPPGARENDAGALPTGETWGRGVVTEWFVSIGHS